jgi:hypothetical protein
MPTTPGVLFVTSKSVNPSVLDPVDFTKWYENSHIPEIQSTGGFSNTQRYESLTFTKDHRDKSLSSVPENKNFAYDFLTTYNMPDLHFRDSEEYKSLSKKARPDNQMLVEKIFKQAEFNSRFCEQQSVDWPAEGGPDPPYLVTLTSSSIPSAAKVAQEITKFSGCQRTRKYQIHEGSVLSKQERTYIPEKSELFLFDFGDLEPVKKVVKMVESADDVQVGFWALRRSYDGAETTPAPWKPSK